MNRIVLLLLCVFLTVNLASNQIGNADTDRFALIINTSDDFACANAYNIDSFPAQSLQAYWVLKDLGYSDDEIVLMLYHVNDDFIDVDGDGHNDLQDALIDVENEDVTKERLYEELRNLATIIDDDDELIVYLVDHGEHHSKTSASFLFEVGSALTEQEFAEWLNEIRCEKMVVLLDFCHSGNFASSLIEPGRIIVASAAGNNEAYYYWEAGNMLSEANKEIFGNAGSVFFHPFWKMIKEGRTIEEAYEYGKEQMLRWAIIDPKSRYAVEIQDPQMFISPKASIIYSPTTNLSIRVAINFEDTSIDPDGTLTSWLWDFGDGTTSSEQHPTHTYAEKGTYTVQLSVTDDDGHTDIETLSITIANLDPTADFIFSPETSETGQPISFTDKSEDPEGELLAYLWDFGDGSTSTKRNPNHSYDKSGSYVVKLTVTDDEGATSTTIKIIDIAEERNYVLYIVAGASSSTLIAAFFVFRRKKTIESTFSGT